ncbi:hypothetical protein GCM10009740_13850 [Terrabacter terrae]|uniref:Uncharacterized protein n=2 Tax=Terrabacter terrae TaxID=318434 RepID=A0ABP5FIK5_9MICO
MPADGVGATATPDISWFDPGPVRDGVDLADNLWTVEHLVRFLPWRRSRLFAVLKTDTFPAPYLLGGLTHRPVWLRRDILVWVAASPRRPVPDAGDEPDRDRRAHPPEDELGDAAQAAVQPPQPHRSAKPATRTHSSRGACGQCPASSGDSSPPLPVPPPGWTMVGNLENLR